MKETSKIPFPTYREQDCTREHCNGIKGKLKTNDKFSFLTISDPFVILCQYTCVCSISEHDSPERI